MRKNLILNLSSSKRLNNNQFEFDLIDIRFTIKNSKNDLFEIINIDQISIKALSNYRAFIKALLEHKSILELKVDSFPVYWVTDCSIKGYYWHWAKDFFFLTQILEDYQVKFQEDYNELLIYVPAEWSFLKRTLDQLIIKLNYTNKVSIVLLKLRKKEESIVNSFLKINYRWITNVKKLSKVNGVDVKLPNSINFRHYGKSQSKENFNEALKRVFKINGHEIESIPFYWFNNPEIPNEFLKYKPSYIQLCKILIKSNFIFFKTILTTKKNIKVSPNVIISSSFIHQEIRDVIKSKIHLLIFHRWISNFFNANKGKFNIYYEDEFYITGRIISHSAELNISKTFGIQHGHFMESQTVYMITDSEIESGLPKPHRFITWGEYYNRLFLENNSISDEYTVSLGNPNYVIHQDENQLPEQILEVLWCLTTYECLPIEWGIVKESLKEFKFDLKIRLHPNSNTKREHVEKMIGDTIGYSFCDKPNILDSIESCDMVIVSAHSSAFLDAIVCKRYCIRLVSRFWDGEHKMRSSFIKTSKTSESFFHNLKDFQTFIDKKKDTNIQDIELSMSRWETHLKESQ